MTAKILVVDDETDLEVLIKQKFRKQIRDEKYNFLFAVNGNDALEKLEANKDVDVVLSDINMPEMDGLTLLSKLKEHHTLLKSVIVSAYGDMDNIRTAMNRGAFDFITKPVNFEDLELTMNKTLEHVLEMKANVKAIRENQILKMYVDENVLNFMSTREFEKSLIANEAIEATVMFIDICGFTKISESEKPDQVVKLLNNYFDVMVKEILAQTGHVDKFIGDAIMAVFKGEYHLDRAVDAALAVRNAIEKLPDLSEEFNFSPQVSIGINCGEMISGNIGSAELRRLDYTVIGDTVNIAQRLQSAAGPNQVYITAGAHEKIKESFACKAVGEMSLKHKKDPIKLFEVLN